MMAHAESPIEKDDIDVIKRHIPPLFVRVNCGFSR